MSLVLLHHSFRKRAEKDEHHFYSPPFPFSNSSYCWRKTFEKYRKTSTAGFSKQWYFLMPQAIQSLRYSKGNFAPVTQSWAVSSLYALCRYNSAHEQIQQSEKTSKQWLKVGLDLSGPLPTPTISWLFESFLKKNPGQTLRKFGKTL